MCSGPYASGLNYDFLLVDKIFKKCRTASKNHEKSEGNVRSCVDSTLDSKNTVRIHYSIVGQWFSDSIQRLFSYLQNCSFWYRSIMLTGVQERYLLKTIERDSWRSNIFHENKEAACTSWVRRFLQNTNHDTKYYDNKEKTWIKAKLYMHTA